MRKVMVLAGTLVLGYYGRKYGDKECDYLDREGSTEQA